MTNDKKPEYTPSDIATWSLHGLLAHLDSYRERLTKEEHEVVRTTVQLEIDRIIAELDRRNREAMAVS
jgi:C-terminal processing protease CtpA/Prc